MILYKTIAGSRLYNLHQNSSDYDYFVVIDKSPPTRKSSFAKQTIVDGVDTLMVDFGTFTNLCQKGVPQALEAAYSRREIYDGISAWRNALRAPAGAWDTYMRTIRSMSDGNYKHRRHALRLAMNLRDLSRYGRFNPTLDDMQIMCINRWAKVDNVYYIAEDIAWELY